VPRTFPSPSTRRREIPIALLVVVAMLTS
jgi:hypothetical protein